MVGQGQIFEVRHHSIKMGWKTLGEQSVQETREIQVEERIVDEGQAGLDRRVQLWVQSDAAGVNHQVVDHKLIKRRHDTLEEMDDGNLTMNDRCRVDKNQEGPCKKGRIELRTGN